MSVSLYSHQKKALDKLHNGCILYGGVGTGKSRTALAYFHEKECGGQCEEFKPMLDPKPLYIITTARKRDTLEWEGELAPFLLSTHKENSWCETEVTIDSWNNIGKYTDVKDSFFIFDEQRVVGYGAWSKAFIKIAKKNRWILLSATPGDTWMDYLPVFIANGFYKNKTEFEYKHVVYDPYSNYKKVKRYFDTGVLSKHRAEILVPMRSIKRAEKHKLTVNVDYDKEMYNMVWVNRWNPYKDKPIREVSELCYTARRVVNSDPDRCEVLLHILKDHPKLIVFYNFDYELDILKLMCEHHDLEFAEWNGHRHEPIPDTDKWVYLVQYLAGAEGWNCIQTNAMLFYSQNYSYKIMEQAAGRIDRLNTPFDNLYYYTLVSGAKIDNSIARALKSKKNFQENGLFL